MRPDARPRPDNLFVPLSCVLQCHHRAPPLRDRRGSHGHPGQEEAHATAGPGLETRLGTDDARPEHNAADRPETLGQPHYLTWPHGRLNWCLNPADEKARIRLRCPSSISGNAQRSS